MCRVTRYQGLDPINACRERMASLTLICTKQGVRAELQVLVHIVVIQVADGSARISTWIVIQICLLTVLFLNQTWPSCLLSLRTADSPHSPPTKAVSMLDHLEPLALLSQNLSTVCICRSLAITLLFRLIHRSS